MHHREGVQRGQAPRDKLDYHVERRARTIRPDRSKRLAVSLAGNPSRAWSAAFRSTASRPDRLEGQPSWLSWPMRPSPLPRCAPRRSFWPSLLLAMPVKSRTATVFPVLPPDRLGTYARWRRLMVTQSLQDMAPARPASRSRRFSICSMNSRRWGTWLWSNGQFLGAGPWPRVCSRA